MAPPPPFGANSAAAISVLKEDWTASLDLVHALDLVAKVLVKSMDTARPAAENLEIGVFEGRNFRFLKDEEVNLLAAKAKDNADKKKAAEQNL